MAARTDLVLDRSIVSGKQAFDRWFYVGLAVLALVMSVIGFSPSLIDTSDRIVPLPLTLTVIVHAFAAAGWLILFLIQSVFAATGRMRWHRSLGVVGVIISVMFVVSGWFTVVEQTRRGFDLAGDLAPPSPTNTPGVLFGATLAVLHFAIFVGAAVWYRRRPEVHKRLMALAAIGVLAVSALLHIISHFHLSQSRAGAAITGGYLVLLSLLPIYDRISRGRIHPVSLWGGVGIFVSTYAFVGLLVPTQAWSSFTAWVMGI